MRTVNDLLRLFKHIAAGMPGDWRFAEGSNYDRNAPNADTWPLLFVERPILVSLGEGFNKTYTCAFQMLDRYSLEGDKHLNQMDKIAALEAAGEHVLRMLRDAAQCSLGPELQWPVDAVGWGPVDNDRVVGMRYEVRLQGGACNPVQTVDGWKLCDYLKTRLDQ